MADMA